MSEQDRDRNEGGPEYGDEAATNGDLQETTSLEAGGPLGGVGGGAPNPVVGGASPGTVGTDGGDDAREGLEEGDQLESHDTLDPRGL